jgi:hypothetical protein
VEVFFRDKVFNITSEGNLGPSKVNKNIIISDSQQPNQNLNYTTFCRLG